MSGIIWKKHGLILDGMKISWDHIVAFYELDKSSEIRMAPQLTDDHINLPPFKPMRVNLAAQILAIQLLQVMLCHE